VAVELPPGTRAESKAVSALREAPRSVCPHCGRDTKTVSGGVCADCWGVKDPANALVFRPPPKTEPLLGWDGLLGWLDDLPWILLVLVGIAVFVARVAFWTS
jgi:hypothetical protein